MFLIRSFLGRVVLAGVVLLAGLVGGWYLFIRESNEIQESAAPVSDAVKAAISAQAASATAAAARSTTPSAAATTAAATQGAATASISTIRGTSYKLVAGQSSAWYLAPEKLSRLPTSSVAKGETKDVTGEFHIEGNALDASQQTTFTVNLRTIKSNESMRDRRMHEALESTKYPEAKFVATSVTGLPEKFTATDSVMQLTGVFDLHGVRKEVTWELKVKEADGVISALATIKFKYTDFGIRKPEVAGFVTVEDEVTIQVQLFIAKV